MHNNKRTLKNFLMDNGVITNNIKDTKINHNTGSKLLDNVTFNNSHIIYIKSLKTKNSFRYDKISTKTLKINCPLISSPLNYICNKILFCGVFPDRLKYTLTKPLHKTGDRCEVSNCSPVSLLTSFSKIFEMVM